MNTSTLEIMSVGYLSGCLQHSPAEIDKAVRKLGIVPAARINGVDHFDATQVQNIASHFRQTVPAHARKINYRQDDD